MQASNRTELEKRSAAISLSDMEIFVFPELMYSLVLANIMSPRIWRWKDDPWFSGIQKMKPYRRISRLKQYIIDHYAFNLDLDTWGLTTKKREIERFRDAMDAEMISQSNALFGYEGDKYYFDIDIRTHFGLDKYDGDTIPYWKTETVEAMDAFVHKPGYQTGAGECVSLATLYAAALFIVAGVPLSDIFLMATPLHSQNFVDVDDGILTNNRRLVTKKMWFNGTALSAQARRALENERVTIVTHESGYIHLVYPEATIDSHAYSRFSGKLHSFLNTALTDQIIGNFLRHHRDIQKCFQLRWPVHGVDKYVPVERAFAYEDGSSYSVTDNTREKLMGEMDLEEFGSTRIRGRIVLNDLEDHIRTHRVDWNQPQDVQQLKTQFACDCLKEEIALQSLIQFCCVTPKLPDAATKQFVASGEPLKITPGMDRESIIVRLVALRASHPTADLAFYAYRDLNATEAEPFLLAAKERNPVFLKAAHDEDDDTMLALLETFPNESIYDGPGRLAQPDEVWNYRRGDGIEKALLYAVFLRQRDPSIPLKIDITADTAIIHRGSRTVSFTSAKQLRPQTWTI